MAPYPRNVQVFNPQTQPPSLVAGINQHGSVSVSIFYSMMQTVLVVRSPWVIYKADAQYEPLGNALDPNDANLLPLGTYVVLSPDKQHLDVFLTSENYRPRTLSLDITGTPRKKSFRDRVRERDGRCCITGVLVPSGRFHKFRASHIWPIAHKDVWDMLLLSRHIQDDAHVRDQGPNSINSIQNGLLLRSDIHDQFDAYDFAINPDNGYRVTDFTEGGELDGLVLWINQNVEAKYRPSDDLLREHFKQCVLANVKGAGQRDEDWMDPEDDHDLSDFSQWGRRIGDEGPSRLELEVASRLYNNEALVG